MTLNVTTGIDPEIDRFVIWRVSTSQYTNMNAAWPRVDGGEVVGANPDFQYFKKVAGSPPDSDHRFTMTTTFTRVAITPSPAAGLPQGTYEPTYTLTKLPLDDLLAQIETAYQEQVRTQFPDTENPSTILVAAGAISKKQNGAVLTANEQTTLDRLVALQDKLLQLATRKQELIDAATADQDYDLTVWPDLT